VLVPSTALVVVLPLAVVSPAEFPVEIVVPLAGVVSPVGVVVDEVVEVVVLDVLVDVLVLVDDEAEGRVVPVFAQWSSLPDAFPWSSHSEPCPGCGSGLHGWFELPCEQSSPGLPGFEVCPGGLGGLSVAPA